MVRQNWRMWSAALDVSPILEAGLNSQVSTATTFGGENLDYRRSRVSWLTGNPEIQTLLYPYVREAGNVFGVYIRDECEMQFTEYHASEGGKYDWHHDVDWNKAEGGDRKISIVVQLSDPSEYEGGRFEFMEVENMPQPECLQVGTVIAFPSYLMHRVTPVTKGVRRSLVAWWSGPTWG